MGAITLVLCQGFVTVTDLAGLLVLDRPGRRNRHDLVVKRACLLARGGAHLRLQRVLVLGLAADAVGFDDVFRGQQHRHLGMHRHIVIRVFHNPRKIAILQR